MSIQEPAKLGLVILGCATLAVAGLWVVEKSTSRPEAVRALERPTEVIKEAKATISREGTKNSSVKVPKQIEKDESSIAFLTEEQQLAIDFFERFISAPSIASEDERLYGIESVSVVVSTDSDATKATSEANLRQRIELVLRKNGIIIDPESSTALKVEVSGVWDESATVLTYHVSMNLFEEATILRKAFLKKVSVAVWTKSAFGSAGANRVEKRMLDESEMLAVSFVTTYLSINRVKRPSP